MKPGFSERTFEFCYNYEYCQHNAALLAACPHIPSQRAEKNLGYDVEIELANGKFKRSLFLQHKVASFAEVRTGQNAQFYAAHNQPYFLFPIDNEQHNVLCELSRTKGNAFYCAPRFHLISKLKEHFRDASIAENAVLLNPLDVGEVTGKERYNVTYNASGRNPTLHPELRRFKHPCSGDARAAPQLMRPRITLDDIQELLLVSA